MDGVCVIFMLGTVFFACRNGHKDVLVEEGK